MPLFSIIVPVFQVQAYLAECLDSVLGQSFTDFELIAVNDASPDGSAAILAGFAARDERVTVLDLERNVGLGPARNAGLDVATGEYLLFLDSDDTLTPGSLQAIADRLADTGSPEVLIFDYARTYWDGREKRSADAAKFTARPDEPEVFTIAERPDLLRLLMVVWNKAYRHDYVREHGFRFPKGYYEDTPWTYPSLFAAEKIALLDMVVVNYRQRRQGGNILATTSRKHFDVFDQYDLVFAFLDREPELAGWRPVLHSRMVEHVRTIAEHPNRVPRGQKDEFLAKAEAYELRYRPAGTAPIPVRRGTGAGPVALRTVARKARKAMVQARPVLRGKVAKPLLDGYQTFQGKLPIEDDLAVFSSYWSRPPACNPAAIQAKLAELAPGYRSVWVVRQDRRGGVAPGTTTVGPGSRGYREAMARARFFVNNVNFPDSMVKRPGTIHLQTHHGTPIKKMGLDLKEYPAARGGLDFERLLERVDRWDYSLSANRHSTLIWERVYPSAYRTLEYGYPRNDVFYQADAAEVRAARAALGIPRGAKAALYTPTLRDYRTTYRPHLDLERFAASLGPDWVVLNRAHYLYDEQFGTGARPSAGGRVIDVSAHPSVETLGLAADVLLTDYSSFVFDYANLDRPIVVFADDWEVYQETRGVYLDLLSGRPGETPGPVARTEAELVEVLRSGAWQDASAQRLRHAFRERFNEFDDGRAAERVVRTVFLGEAVALPVVPLERRTPAPSPAEADG